MPIQVTCPKCLKRFQVSDKFAGKQGPCPSCKNVIKVPSAEEQVVIHEAPSDAPTDSKGRSVLKPITREDTDVTRKGLILTIVSVIAIFTAAVGVRMMSGPDQTPIWASIAGILLLAPPLVWSGYNLVYDRELEPYRGAELWQRVGIVSAVFAVLWAVYAFAPAYVLDLDQASEMTWMVAGIAFAVMIVGGAFAALAAFDLEFPSGLVISGLYFLSVVLLALVAGVVLAGREVDDRPGPRAAPAAATALPSTSPTLAAIPPINKLLQDVESPRNV
ncbi:hypothetical protein Pan14r_06340 [Crateriforma conspicua]|uniref:Zinc finger/thioredoxin putative domain-containing protein n=2 Tax=Crateriforma conspicua TaxID=2527996 RepID=A0A5C5XZG6_9PLAN|nr:hypothetical protein Pan14r_06340 [Crateriforma conspicua]